MDMLIAPQVLVLVEFHIPLVLVWVVLEIRVDILANMVVAAAVDLVEYLLYLLLPR